MTNLVEAKKNNLVWDLAKVVLAIALLYFVVSKTNYSQLLIIKNDISWLWLGVLAVLFVVMTLLKALQYYVLIGKKGAYWNVFRITVWQNAISNFIATSAGIASYMTMLKTDEDVKVTRSGIAFIITKFGDLFAIFLTLSVSSLVVWDMIAPLHLLTILILTGILAGFAFSFITILWREKFMSSLSGVIVSLQLDRFSLVKKVLDALDTLTREERSSIFRLLYKGMILSLVYMTATMMFAYTSLKVFNVTASIWTILYVGSLTQIVSFIPIQVFGGLGVAELANVYLYSLFGLDEEEISAVMIGLRAIFYLMNGVIFLYIPVNAFLGRYYEKLAHKK